MPIQIDYTAPSRVNYPNSFWAIAMENKNHLGGTESLVVNGYATVGDFNAGGDFIAQQTFLFNGPDYDRLIRDQYEVLDTHFSYYELIEQALLDPTFTTFFTGGSYTQFSIVRPTALEVGDELETRINVTFTGVLTGADPLGHTIKVNGVAATITAAAQNPFDTKQIQYDLSAAIEAADEVTWEYDSSVGLLTDVSLLPVRSFGAQAAVNNVGEHLWFDSAENSIWLASRC